jgi:hypothetical protein
MDADESLRRFALEYYAAVNSHDEVGLKERSANVPAASMIGTDAGEIFVGADAVAGAFAEQFVTYADVVFEPGDLRAWSHGDAGWFVDEPTIVVGDQRTPCRASGTAVRLEGAWQLVQAHMSIPYVGEG